MKEQIEKIIQEEQDRATGKYGNFKSTHEAWAVLLEELEETRESLAYTLDAHARMWDAIKVKRTREQLEAASYMYDNARLAIEELIQVAAMAKKIKEDIAKGVL